MLLPYYLIVCAYTLAWGQVPWASVFLVGNFGFADPVDRTMLPYLYWFVEAYAQMLLVWAGAFLIPSVRRFALTDPFRLGLVMLAVAMAVRFVSPALWSLGGRQIFTLPWIFYLSVFGWLAATAGSRAQRVQLLLAAALVMPVMAYDGGNWTGSWFKHGLQLVVIAMLLLVPQIALPPRLARAVLPMAAASYHIYLVHRFVPELLLAKMEATLPPGIFDAAAVLGGVAAGLAVYAGQRAATRAFARYLGKLGQGEALAAVSG